MLQSKSLQEQMLRNYIQTIFNKYDTDRSGTLDVHEMTFFFNDLFKALQIPTVVTDAQSLQAIKSIDSNNDGAVNKEELFTAFKKMLNQYVIHNARPAQNQGGNIQGNGQGYNGYNQGGYNGGSQYNGYGNNQPYNQGHNPQYNNQYNPQYGYQHQGAQIYYNSQQPQYPNQGYNPNQTYMNSTLPSIADSMGRPNVNQGYVNPQMQQSQQQYNPNQQIPPQYNNFSSQNNSYNPYR